MTPSKTTQPLQLDGYIRVSSVGDRDVESESYITEKVQREKIEAWAVAKGIDVVEWHVDRDVSGGKMTRPGLDALMARVRAGETGGLITAKLDRLSRSGTAGTATLIEELESLNAELVVIEPNIDTTDPVFGPFIRNLFLELAAMERRRQGEVYRTSRTSAIGRGIYIGNATPFGYELVRENENSRSGRLTVHPVEGPIVTELFRRRAAGGSVSSLVVWLQSTGTHPAGQRVRHKDEKRTVELARKPWAHVYVTELLKRRVYLGELSDAHSGRDVVVKDTHPPLTDENTWAMAQRSRPPRKQSQEVRLLSGLARCANCRYALVWQEWKGDGQAFYRCTAASSNRCDGPVQIKAQTGEAKRVEMTLPNGSTGYRTYGGTEGLDEYVWARAKASLEWLTARAYGESQELRHAQQELKTRVGRLDMFADDFELREGLGRDAELREANRLRQAVEEAQQWVDEAQARAPFVEQRDRPLPGDMEEMSVEDRNRCLSTLIECVFVRRGKELSDRVHIVWKGEPVPELPFRGRPKGGVAYVPTPFVFPVNVPDDAGEVLP